MHYLFRYEESVDPIENGWKTDCLSPERSRERVNVAQFRNENLLLLEVLSFGFLRFRGRRRQHHTCIVNDNTSKGQERTTRRQHRANKPNMHRQKRVSLPYPCGSCIAELVDWVWATCDRRPTAVVLCPWFPIHIWSSNTRKRSRIPRKGKSWWAREKKDTN